MKVRLIDQYKAWDKANPEFYPLFCRFALQLAAAGHAKASPSLIFERIRWESKVSLKSKTEYKLPNSLKSLYARRFLRDHPKLKGFFAVRLVLTAVTDRELLEL